MGRELRRRSGVPAGRSGWRVAGGGSFIFIRNSELHTAVRSRMGPSFTAVDTGSGRCTRQRVPVRTAWPDPSHLRRACAHCGAPAARGGGPPCLPPAGPAWPPCSDTSRVGLHHPRTRPRLEM